MACKDCTHRHANCHADCEDYKNYKKELKQKQDRIYNNRKKDILIDSIERNRYKK